MEYFISSRSASSMQSLSDKKKLRQALAYSIADTKQSMVLDLQRKKKTIIQSNAQPASSSILV